jgi:hypothetical protein
MAIAQGSTRVRRMSRSVWVKPPAHPVDDLHHPDGAPAGDEGSAEDGAGHELGLAVELAGEARVAGRVVDDGGLAGLGHPSRDPFAIFTR